MPAICPPPVRLSDAFSGTALAWRERGIAEMGKSRQTFGQRRGSGDHGPLNIYTGHVSAGADAQSVGRAPEMESRNTIYRPGEAERPSLHNSYLERNWPKFGALAFALLALGYTVQERGTDHPVSLAILFPLAGGFAYLALSGVRRALNAVHTVRTEGGRNRAFTLGLALGLAFFVYSTFIDPTTIMGHEFGLQTVFRDGFQGRDLSALIPLVFRAALMMVAGGVILERLASLARALRGKKADAEPASGRAAGEAEGEGMLRRLLVLALVALVLNILFIFVMLRDGFFQSAYVLPGLLVYFAMMALIVAGMQRTVFAYRKRVEELDGTAGKRAPGGKGVVDARR